MSYTWILSLIIGYFILLIIVAHLTSKKASDTAFFTGDRSSPWYVVAFGMIGASLSGVTFISVPGWVASSQFSYMQMVLGYLVGYAVIALILLPLYYRLQLTSIYTYLSSRFGFWSYKTGAVFFLLSRIVGASFRLFLVANVLQIAVFDFLHIPYFLTVFITIALIWVYTFRSGIKTVVWTDTLQTFFMLSALCVTVYVLGNKLNLSLAELSTMVYKSNYARIFFFDDVNTAHFFPKKFIAGVFMAIVMTGLDQDMMQKNLSCRNLKEAQKNMYWFSATLVIVNLLFLSLGVLLLKYYGEMNIALPKDADDIYPVLALQHLGGLGASVFILGVIAAAYSSADSALTSLTTSFCIDILSKPNIEKRKRYLIHFAFSIVLFFVIILFKEINDESVIKKLFTYAGYTYGPLLGLYAFGLFTKIKVHDTLTPWICLLMPILTFLIGYCSATFLGYTIGFELLLINGFLTFLGLLLISKTESNHVQEKTV